ncbi:hypothetical protein ADICEAN_03308 [Cesiribacter andamanensis AMV16]|uniref:TonB-linked outer membrane protein, SusC/RagA family n=2 Tax=Cesiribacter TaxID=1133570 RepID=M7N2W9_9BACT|nr:hypothetical protein ADICEAN_03308 [Cesiribacter andamanensis AMV16]
MISLVLSNVCFSQIGTLEGFVYDSETKTGIVNATVKLQGQNPATRTDSVGRFVIRSLPTGTYDVLIYCRGYRETVQKAVVVPTDSVVDLQIAYLTPCQYNALNNVCHICKKQDEVIPIAYGLPMNSTFRRAKKGKVYLGGCVVTYCDPNWYCKRDKIVF